MESTLNDLNHNYSKLSLWFPHIIRSFQHRCFLQSSNLMIAICRMKERPFIRSSLSTVAHGSRIFQQRELYLHLNQIVILKNVRVAQSALHVLLSILNYAPFIGAQNSWPKNRRCSYVILQDVILSSILIMFSNSAPPLSISISLNSIPTPFSSSSSNQGSTLQTVTRPNSHLPHWSAWYCVKFCQMSRERKLGAPLMLPIILHRNRLCIHRFVARQRWERWVCAFRAIDDDGAFFVARLVCLMLIKMRESSWHPMQRNLCHYKMV